MRLQEWITQHCVNIRSFSRRAGISPPVVYKALKCPLHITLDSAHKICRATGYMVELQDLITEKKAAKEPPKNQTEQRNSNKL